MIRSMTGFGRAEAADEEKSILVEIKGVNHRYGEIQAKLPRKYALLEEKVKRFAGERLQRGKVDVFVKYERKDSEAQSLNLDKALAIQYYARMQELARELDLPFQLNLKDLMELPGVASMTESETSLEQVWMDWEPVLTQAIEELVSMRCSEGEALFSDFQNRITQMLEMSQALEARSPQVVQTYRQKLSERIQELEAQAWFDDQRLAAEVALFADKASIDEEVVRLKSHFQQFRDLLSQESAVGRKLDFLCQEMNREINTIGSKANDLGMTQLVVELKSELEKLREQVQNVE